LINQKDYVTINSVLVENIRADLQTSGFG